VEEVLVGVEEVVEVVTVDSEVMVQVAEPLLLLAMEIGRVRGRYHYSV
jgi:hypothetical protein